MAQTDSLNQLLALLSTEYNRYVLYYLCESPEDVVSLEELTEYVLDQQAGTGSRDRKQIATFLYHSGLPKLADTGVVEYDGDDGTVRYLGHPLLEELLRVVAEREEVTRCRQ